ncbi:VIT family protein [Zymomonas mobilis subsp. mobilis str. CP4 = NRRL B-14023]|uniref:VIT1/CCC1 transporter family protein n=1 Tax=Zymomonas mobilis TaxID=542 RepID=UPI0003F1F5C6|nr:VIT family protein [Zymomonas mobilis]AHJ70916.1 VIT family protein [Zymomonas mobilis subsp. mobilis NRRL B-12526]AHJ72769.1 VIT family protein [Zymomonas mobilis subsp. mobilis str. CP4 = NRRL B-14023]
MVDSDEISTPVQHYVIRQMGWLRASVLGANDGILSTSSLMIGVARAHGSSGNILLAGMSGLIAGALSMAAGEYVSVSSQHDMEQADVAREHAELKANPHAEKHELAEIYVERGLDRELALQVAEQLMAHNALEAHLRDELGLTDSLIARPVQAALASAISFSGGAIVPFLTALFSPPEIINITISLISILCLAVLGMVGAHLGGANVPKAALRVTFCGALAMIGTAAIGSFFGTQV